MENRKISHSDNSAEPFNIGKLTVSIAGAFSHNREKAAYDALWLAETVEGILSSEYSIITPDDIAAVTHQTLKRYDELAAIQYAATHHLIATVRRRGRPSLSTAERAPQKRRSPSR